MLLVSVVPDGICFADSVLPSLGATQTFHLATGEGSCERVEPDEGVVHVILRFAMHDATGGLSVSVRVACVQTG